MNQLGFRISATWTTWTMGSSLLLAWALRVSDRGNGGIRRDGITAGPVVICASRNFNYNMKWLCASYSIRWNGFQNFCQVNHMDNEFFLNAGMCIESVRQGQQLCQKRWYHSRTCDHLHILEFQPWHEVTSYLLHKMNQLGFRISASWTTWTMGSSLLQLPWALRVSHRGNSYSCVRRDYITAGPVIICASRNFNPDMKCPSSAYYISEPAPCSFYFIQVEILDALGCCLPLKKLCNLFNKKSDEAKHLREDVFSSSSKQFHLNSWSGLVLHTL